MSRAFFGIQQRSRYQRNSGSGHFFFVLACRWEQSLVSISDTKYLMAIRGGPRLKKQVLRPISGGTTEQSFLYNFQTGELSTLITYQSISAIGSS